MIICPSNPCMGGMSSSFFTAFTSLTAHCHWPFPDWVALISG
jgi:hypothetical protein